MAADDSKAHLWASVQALMRQRYGEENLNRLARDVRVGPATASRPKAQPATAQKIQRFLQILFRMRLRKHSECGMIQPCQRKRGTGSKGSTSSRHGH